LSRTPAFSAGGAFLEFMEGRKLPAIEALKEKVN
jgi:3-phosphoglycerate kinase